jgi:hypothetical protein
MLNALTTSAENVGRFGEASKRSRRPSSLTPNCPTLKYGGVDVNVCRRYTVPSPHPYQGVAMSVDVMVSSGDVFDAKPGQ